MLRRYAFMPLLMLPLTLRYYCRDAAMLLLRHVYADYALLRRATLAALSLSLQFAVAR